MKKIVKQTVREPKKMDKCFENIAIERQQWQLQKHTFIVSLITKPS